MSSVQIVNALANKYSSLNEILKLKIMVELNAGNIEKVESLLIDVSHNTTIINTIKELFEVTDEQQPTA